MDGIISTWKNFRDFSGRSGRREFWMFFLFNLVVTIVLSALDRALWHGDTQILGFVYSLAVIVPGLAVAVRRLHDTGRSGWWALLGIIPFLNLILLVLCALRGEDGTNAYGPPPAA